MVELLKKLAAALMAALKDVLLLLLKNDPVAAVSLELRRTGLGVRIWLGEFEFEVL
jgi:hypothetical protein